MIGKIKSALQDKMYVKCIEDYRKELRSQTDPYLLWVKENEAGTTDVQNQETPVETQVVYIENCGKSFSLSDIDKKYVIFASENGEIADNAASEIKKYFESHQNTDILYADEDSIMSGVRFFPWTKPMWSPDTLISFLYFGNIFAVRREAFLNVGWLENDDYRQNIYDFVLKAIENGKKPGHIEKMLFHAYKKSEGIAEAEKELMCNTDFIGVGSSYDVIRESAFARRGISGKMVTDAKTGISYPIYDTGNEPLVSIVIPSKDNQDVLKQCIRSIYSHTDYKNFEIIVVDNGSSARVRIGLENFKKEYDFNYMYVPMEFNFSRMCNIGVKEAKGEYILLLNDDMEAFEDSWLRRMVGQASLTHVGAVGAKLLYPNTTKIQHVGITNTIWGPGHKLKQLEDTQSYYYGRNRFIYDLIGVTAACLLVKKKTYDELGGLYEGLAVAYNDVDFCFRLCEKGLYNVQRNDVVLYHHESLSRGDDMQDEGKLKRLKDEQKELYKRHIKLYKKDPFIGTILNSGEPEYCCRWLEGYELVNIFDASVIKEGKKLPPVKKMNQAIMIVVEDCGKENFAKAVTRNGQSEKEYYLIKGWAYVPGVDNARYKFKILFVNSKGKVWELPLQKRYRKDVAKILPDEVNVEMTGFCNWIFDGALPPDTYELWMAAKDGCSRQRLYRSMEKTLVIE
jgi:GT2 family glycosyltransferase